jgi:hypothetical protein
MKRKPNGPLSALDRTRRAPKTRWRCPMARADGQGRSEYLSNLDFHYSVDGRARWKPVRVYNDGVKTIIEMPHAMEQTEAPSLLIVRAGGSVSKAADTSIVNYRLQDGRYIVDQIFDQAVLISGVGKRQERVTITRGADRARCDFCISGFPAYELRGRFAPGQLRRSGSSRSGPSPR